MLSGAKLGTLISYLIFEHHYNNDLEYSQQKAIIPYFAFGSMMDPDVLKTIVGPIHFLGTAQLQNYALIFQANNKSLSGRATLSPKTGATIEGAIFLLTLEQRNRIACWRRAEGLDKQVEVSVDTNHPSFKKMKVSIEVQNGENKDFPPTTLYKNHLIKAAEKIHLSAEYIQSLRQHEQKIPSRI